jgi:hypothetical protein
MFKWFEKIFAVTPREIKKEKPLVLVPSKKELAKLTKKALENLGRTHKIELDRRETKDKLVAQLHKHIKSLNK